MGAVIDKDHLCENGISESSMAGTQLFGGLKSDDPLAFKLFDDDGELYYSGRMDPDDLYVDDERLGYELAYELYRWAMYDSGCTDLEVDELDGRGFKSIYG